MTDTCIDLLRRLEWSAHTRGEGMDPALRGTDGFLHPTCPECRGLKDTPRARGQFNAVGHQRNCVLALLIAGQQYPASPTVNDLDLLRRLLAEHSITWTLQQILGKILRPDWPSVGKVHDWRNYIPDTITEDWRQLPWSTRIALFIQAEVHADAEEWE